MVARRARIYDALALLTVIIVVILDQWTKALVVANLSPEGSKPPVPLIGKYLVINYTQNRGAAFSMLANNGNVLLAILIVAAIGVVSYLYLRALNTGPLFYKLVLGLIIGGALGNLVNRALNGGYVVDFISFRIPEINYYFAIFNVADACISIGVLLLFVFVLSGGLGRPADSKPGHQETQTSVTSPTSTSGPLQTTKQDAQS